MTTKPLIFVDLDDTLFQTHRRISPDADFRVASVDKNGQALAYMKPKQQIFSDWLFASADVIPVTARSVEALSRVKLQFQHAAICSHGGTIIDADNNMDMQWFDLQQQQVAKLDQSMQDLVEQIHEYAADLGSVRTWAVEENGLKIYTVAKQNDTEQPLFLDKIVEKLPAEISEQFYLHMNGNNLAIIPLAVSKKNAVQFYLEKYDPLQQRAVMGLGDSLSDFGFLSCCDWFGMPKNSQLHRFSETALDLSYQSKGYFGNV
ncbi:hydroxymethylpyrimidine pyrophosphatase-like HAD family hydrolase [Acinetobacter calcoaceticus]|uniref:Hydroxymethylpyrimidine pyrophosphatase-like HAD family hydrolase n=1 Tax=Acinetobacter calcoaceticus TaxID=471 RepID=A0A4R1XT89_ACICA|nr:hydroxymethylpyrimidine pyrophosphatase-like HAD family hydrolase [Acinetobacter calcoaceticus]